MRGEIYRIIEKSGSLEIKLSFSIVIIKVLLVIIIMDINTVLSISAI